MKALAQFQQQVLFRRVRNTVDLGRQLRISAAKIIGGLMPMGPLAVVR
jgi:hypothetical protein